MRPLKILAWHSHAGYLHYLTQAPHEFYLLTKAGRPPGYAAAEGFPPPGPNVHELPLERARREQFDCILFQDEVHYTKDQYELLSPSQRALPRIYVEHTPPRGHPTDMPHLIDDPNVLLVHDSHANALLWDSGRTPTKVIEPGVRLPHGVSYHGELDTGLVVVNHLARGTRRLGADLFAEARAQVSLDLAGHGSELIGGMGHIEHNLLPAFASHYRYLFNPVRHGSPGLAVIEAMMIGLPLVTVATAELAQLIHDGDSGFVDSRPAVLVERMHELSRDTALARMLGARARKVALERFSLERFLADWNAALYQVTGGMGR